MNPITKAMYKIGEAAIALTLLTVSISITIIALTYIYAFWGAVPNRLLQFQDLKSYYIGLGLLFLIACMATAIFTDDEEVKEYA